jgi:pyridoxine 5-phosphate synthase
VRAARQCEAAGADGITAHLREDRRHVQDDDVERLAREVRTVFNLEIAGTDAMIALACRLRPHQVTLVPERREEVTTEGGLDVTRDPARLARQLAELRAAGVRASLFIDPDDDAVRASHDLGADAIELHTGRFAHGAPAPPRPWTAPRPRPPRSVSPCTPGTASRPTTSPRSPRSPRSRSSTSATRS